MTCFYFVAIGKTDDRFGRKSLSQKEKSDTVYLEIQQKVFRKGNKSSFSNIRE